MHEERKKPTQNTGFKKPFVKTHSVDLAVGSYS